MEGQPPTVVDARSTLKPPVIALTMPDNDTLKHLSAGGTPRGPISKASLTASNMNNPPPLPTSTTTSGGTNTTIQLCASCDRCRTRKTKCDGSRPCLNCKNRYLRVHKLNSEDLSGADFIQQRAVESHVI
eukprot:scaffold3345_cov83-Skeletonema_dohrnii-CCMP3373.AAC.2